MSTDTAPASGRHSSRILPLPALVASTWPIVSVGQDDHLAEVDVEVEPLRQALRWDARRDQSATHE